MKTLKFGHEQAEAVRSGNLQVTWRINDDKDITVDDVIEFIDKKSDEAFGTGLVDQVLIKRFAELTKEDVEAVTTLTKYYGHDIDPSLHVKMIHFSFTPYPESKVRPGSDATVKVEDIKLYADGGSRGNPGPSASGYVLYDMNDGVLKKDGFYLGITTNNQAEYQALKKGLEDAHRFKARTVEVYMDSLLVVNQMKGIFKVRNRDLWPIHQAITQLAAGFSKITYTHVPRALNKAADAMVNEVLDAQAGKN